MITYRERAAILLWFKDDINADRARILRLYFLTDGAWYLILRLFTWYIYIFISFIYLIDWNLHLIMGQLNIIETLGEWRTWPSRFTEMPSADMLSAIHTPSQCSTPRFLLFLIIFFTGWIYSPRFRFLASIIHKSLFARRWGHMRADIQY